MNDVTQTPHQELESNMQLLAMTKMVHWMTSFPVGKKHDKQSFTSTIKMHCCSSDCTWMCTSLIALSPVQWRHGATHIAMSEWLIRPHWWSTCPCMPEFVSETTFCQSRITADGLVLLVQRIKKCLHGHCVIATKNSLRRWHSMFLRFFSHSATRHAVWLEHVCNIEHPQSFKCKQLLWWVTVTALSSHADQERITSFCKKQEQRTLICALWSWCIPHSHSAGASSKFLKTQAVAFSSWLQIQFPMQLLSELQSLSSAKVLCGDVQRLTANCFWGADITSDMGHSSIALLVRLSLNRQQLETRQSFTCIFLFTSATSWDIQAWLTKLFATFERLAPNIWTLLLPFSAWEGETTAWHRNPICHARRGEQCHSGPQQGTL